MKEIMQMENQEAGEGLAPSDMKPPWTAVGSSQLGGRPALLGCFGNDGGISRYNNDLWALFCWH